MGFFNNIFGKMSEVSYDSPAADYCFIPFCRSPNLIGSKNGELIYV